MSTELTHRLFEESRTDLYQFRSEKFTLSSGKESYHYFDARAITLRPTRLALLARLIRDELLPAQNVPVPQAVGGLTLGADPVTVALSLAYAEQSRIVYPLIVRKEAKGHGLGRRIEGAVQAVSEVLVLDDVITTGASTLQAVEAFREAGLTVQRALCVVDREEGGADLLGRHEVEVLSVFAKSDFTQGISDT